MSFILHTVTAAFSTSTRNAVQMRPGYYRIESHTSIASQRAAVCTFTNKDGDAAHPRSYILPRAMISALKAVGAIERV